ncbi:glutaredoxin 3 [Thalassotalea agarivorans]|uniref:Glutaredoxin n=1 Tax=Thalassotalea agarivorans TaxID=349064 RepID=A0A1I0HQ64_THASX|nr:glutaredoxin 3 [Thalassotalea agarivorans]SET86150.1 glutaredoxin 3 [Thalassotalea agarivorans]
MAKIDIYTKMTCFFCHRAKALLQQKGVRYNEIKIDANPAKRPEMIERSGGGYTVPQIFIGDVHVGGCDDLFALEAKGKLDKLLEKA